MLNLIVIPKSILFYLNHQLNAKMSSSQYVRTFFISCLVENGTSLPSSTAVYWLSKNYI